MSKRCCCNVTVASSRVGSGSPWGFVFTNFKMMFLGASLNISNNEAEAKGYGHCCNFTYSWSLGLGGVRGESEDKSHKSATTERKGSSSSLRYFGGPALDRKPSWAQKICTKRSATIPWECGIVVWFLNNHGSQIIRFAFWQVTKRLNSWHWEPLMAPREHTSQGHCSLLQSCLGLTEPCRCSRHRKLVWSGGPDLHLSRISYPVPTCCLCGFSFHLWLSLDGVWV